MCQIVHVQWEKGKHCINTMGSLHYHSSHVSDQHRQCMCLSQAADGSVVSLVQQYRCPFRRGEQQHRKNLLK